MVVLGKAASKAALFDVISWLVNDPGNETTAQMVGRQVLGNTHLVSYIAYTFLKKF